MSPASVKDGDLRQVISCAAMSFRLFARHAAPFLLVAGMSGIQAAPYVPADDAKVLERLPLKATDPTARELRELRARVTADPDDADQAARLARRYFRLAMAEGDPRYIGYGEAALRKWWVIADAPHAVTKMRALLKQYKHDFAGALTDFALAGQHDPSDEEIWSWRAALHIVQANYVEATNDFVIAGIVQGPTRPQDVANAVEQDRPIDRFGDKVRGAGVIRAIDRFDVFHACDDDHRDSLAIRKSAQHLADGVTVHYGHGDIQQHQVRQARAD